MQILITGAAGFIGADLAKRLIELGHEVIGLDNFNDYYDVNLKQARISYLQESNAANRFSCIEADIVDRNSMQSLFQEYQFDVVVHLAAQAGVRHSIDAPYSYVDSNLVGFANVLEECRQAKVPHLVYASSSSVYGANQNFPFCEDDRVDNPTSLYAATKKANELMAHSYSHLYGMRCTGLRFFTVYGPWGRPDMAPFRFASRMLKGDAIPVYNQGDMLRDFTYVDDISRAIVQVVEDQRDQDGYGIFNIGRGQAVPLMHFIETLANHLGVEANLNFLPMQDGDVPRTMASTDKLAQRFGYQPSVIMEEGVAKFAAWYKEYYAIN